MDTTADALLAFGGHEPELIDDADVETMDLWSVGGLWDNTEYQGFSEQQASELELEACGRTMTFAQTPASQLELGETGYVVWDGGIVMAKYLEHQCEQGVLALKGTRCVDLGSGCGVVGCVAAALNPGGVVLTDRANLLKLLKGNVAKNHLRAKVKELDWGQDYSAFAPPLDFVLGADIVFNENVLPDLMHCLKGLCGPDTIAIVANELRCPEVHGEWIELCLRDFDIVRVPQGELHPDFVQPRICIYALRKKRVGEAGGGGEGREGEQP